MYLYMKGVVSLLNNLLSDIDECNLGISGCSQLCTNSIGSFECGCYYGYQLTSDNKSCIGEFICFGRVTFSFQLPCQE